MTSLPVLAAAFVLVLTIVLGLMSARKARTVTDYWVAGRTVGVFTNASAISSNYLSAASFLGVAAVVWASGFDGVWYAVGFAAGYILLLLFVASPLRRFGKYTIPDFCQGRFGSKRLRQAGILWAMVISALYIVPQMVGVGTLMESTTGLPWQLGVVVLGGVITLYVAVGGMTGVTVTQMVQFWIMLVAMFAPLFVLLPRYGYGELLTYAYQDTATYVTDGAKTITGVPAFTDAEQAKFGNLRGWLTPFGKYGLFESVSLLVALVCGTAGLPHILARFYTNPDAQKARWSTVWVLVFIGLFYITTPIWGTYARVVLGPDAVLFAHGKPNPNSMMFQVAAQAGEWAKALVAAGAVAALLSTVAGLLIALSSAIAHDLYGEIIRPGASDRSRIAAAKIAVIGCGIAGIAIGILFRDRNVAVMVGLAFAVAASTFFPLLVCGIWWRRMTEKGALAGLTVGGIISAVVVIGRLITEKMGVAWPIEQPAVISVPAALITLFVVSKLTYPKESEETRKLLDEAFHALHRPEESVRKRGTAVAAS